jgi:hypothetical protein
MIAKDNPIIYCNETNLLQKKKVSNRYHTLEAKSLKQSAKAKQCTSKNESWNIK